MTTKRLVFVACFIASFLAGMAFHAAVSRQDRRSRSRHFTAELGLTAEQAARFDEIWSAAMKESHELARTGFEEIRAARDEAVADLLDEGDLERYAQVLADEKAAREDLDSRRKAVFEKAVEETKEILDERQRAKYDELLAERKARREAREKERTENTENNQ
jgi:Spy/CpxP family protein refolding chaperone